MCISYWPGCEYPAEILCSTYSKILLKPQILSYFYRNPHSPKNHPTYPVIPQKEF